MGEVDGSETRLVPNDLFIADLFQQYLLDASAMTIRDDHINFEASRERFLLDVLALRNAIFAQLPDNARAALLQKGADVFICVVLPGGYDFVVASIAIISIGAAVVPLTTTVLLEEAEYFVALCGAESLVTTDEFENLSHTLKQRIKIEIIDIGVVLKPSESRGKSCHLQLADEPALDPEKAGLVMFTSGTTGPPKGVLHSRKAVYLACKTVQQVWNIGPGDVFLSPITPQWISGFLNTIGGIMGGALMELCSTVFNPPWFWNRIKPGDVTIFSCSPAYYTKLAVFFETDIANGPQVEREKVVNGVRNIRILASAGSLLAQSISEFWAKLRPRQRLFNNYGTTETMYMALDADLTGVETDSWPGIGRLVPGASSNLADGEEGELGLKAPTVFKRYVSKDPKTMDGVFDDQGYFKTGDLARRKGPNYVILGRASQDVIRFSGWKMFTHDIEEQILQLSGIGEVMILGVDDDDCGERVAAIIRPSFTTCTVPQGLPMNLKSLRECLSAVSSLPVYKYPTLLRLLGIEEQLPMSRNGKLSKTEARKRFLKERIGVEVWDLNAADDFPSKPWDWGGIGTGADRV